MKKILLSLIVAGLTMSAFAGEKEKCTGGEKCNNMIKCGEKPSFDNSSLEDIKVHISDKIAKDEKRVAGHKECLAKNTKEELKSCMEDFKGKEHPCMKDGHPEKKEGKGSHKPE